MKSNLVEIVNEVKRSDSLWRFACGDVCTFDEKVWHEPRRSIRRRMRRWWQCWWGWWWMIEKVRWWSWWNGDDMVMMMMMMMTMMMIMVAMSAEMGKVISTEIFRILLLRPNTLCAGQHDIIVWFFDFWNISNLDFQQYFDFFNSWSTW